MEVDHAAVVHLVDVVAREHDDVVGREAVDEVDVLVDRIGRASIPASHIPHARVGLEHVDAAGWRVEVPRRTCANVAIEDEGLVLRENAHHPDAGVCAVRKRKVDDAVLATVGYRGFGSKACEHAEPAALSACQYHGDAFLVLVHLPNPPQVLLIFEIHRRQRWNVNTGVVGPAFESAATRLYLDGFSLACAAEALLVTREHPHQRPFVRKAHDKPSDGVRREITAAQDVIHDVRSRNLARRGAWHNAAQEGNGVFVAVVLVGPEKAFR